jgi:hypothetical protein
MIGRPSDMLPGGGPWKIIDTCHCHVHNTVYAARLRPARCICPRAIALRSMRAQKATVYKRRVRDERHVPHGVRRAPDRAESCSPVRKVNEAPIPHFTGHEPCGSGEGQPVFNQAVDAPGTARLTDPAVKLCSTCPLLAECRNWVLKAELEPGAWGGVYGGLTVKDRKALARHATA